MEKKIVFIMTDSQRWDMLGCYGNKDMKTPNLDRLATEGMRFDRAYTTQPVCGPARSAIFTGIFPHSNGSWANCMPLADNVKTIGQRLRDNGFHTAYIGKWHLDGGDYFGLGRCPDGWDSKYWYDMRNYLEELSDEDRAWSRTNRIMSEKSVTEDFTFGHRCSNRAIDFLQAHGHDDFFLTVSYDEPHHPFVCPEPYSSMYEDYKLPQKENLRDDLRNKPGHHEIWAEKYAEANKDKNRRNPKYYLGCNSYVDYEIGRVLDAIEKHAPDAVVIYTSDHGEMMYSHSLCGKGPAMYDEITRIPLIVSWKGKIKEGCSGSQPVSHIDLAPTIMEIMELPIPKLLEGKSFVSTLMDSTIRTNNAVFMEFSRYEIDHDKFGGYQPIRAVFDGKYKLVVNLMTSDELYDLEGDPEEMCNLIGSEEHETIRNILHDLILEWMNRTRDPFRGYYWKRRPWRKDAVATWDDTGFTRQRENEEYEPRQLDYCTGMEMEDAARFGG